MEKGGRTLPFWKNQNGSIKDASKWARPKCWFDKQEADDKVEFIESYCRHSKGELAGQLFKLSRWQKEIVRGIFGWKRSSDDLRLYREVFIELGKKNGKSTFAAALAAVILLTDKESGSEIYSVAAETEQAAIIFEIARDMIRQDPELAKVTELFRRSIIYKNSSYKVLSADADTKEGKNSHAVLFDELHVQPNRTLYDNLKTGMAARRQPLMVMLTTAGWDRNSLCWEKYQKAKNINAGIVKDDSYLGIVFEADDKDDWTNPKVWAKANPNLGISVNKQFLQAECDEAKRVPAYENTFKRKHLSIWTEQEVRWMQMAEWDACAAPIYPESLHGRLCYAGLDLAKTTDLSALVFVFPPKNGDHWEDDGTIPTPDDCYIVLPFFWKPQELLKDHQKRDMVPYDSWIAQRLLFTTPGKVIDNRWIIQKIVESTTEFRLSILAYDRYGATDIIRILCDEPGFTEDEKEHENYGKPLLALFGQGYISMSAPTKKLNELVLQRRIMHGGHPVLRWNASNVVVTTDPAENIKPDKAKSTARIDGITALIEGLAMAVKFGSKENENPYESRLGGEGSVVRTI